MTLYNTTFCFVCTHLASGEKDGDEVRRNFDVSEILKKTKFSHSFKAPESILEHEYVVKPIFNKLIYLLDVSFCSNF